MAIKAIKRNRRKQIIMGGLCAIGVISALVYFPSRAKYKATESFNIANGTVNYKSPDFKMISMYTSEDGSNYTEIDRMPDSGYVINESKSYCNLNGSKDTSVRLYTNSEKEHVISNLTKGDKCYLYFDKDEITAEDVLGNLGIENPKEPTSNMFASVATTDEGVFKVDDPVYGGTSYYYRGAVTNNYVKFAGFCWRIIRINGDGSIRMIYDGTTCHANGQSTAESIAVQNIRYNPNRDRSEYVGYTYTQGSQRGRNSASDLKTQTETWYSSNLASYADEIADGKFCNDRNVQSGYTWSSQPSSAFYYAAGRRLDSAKTPSLACNTGDVYTLKVGAITADEVSFAGGVHGTRNSSYYLYNGQYYWTMSPYEGNSVGAVVFFVYDNGMLYANYYVISTTPGIRPVINLKADTVFSSGDGSQSSPFTVQ